VNINVHIERLILDGLSVTRSQGPLVQAAVEAELARLLATDGLSPELQVGGAVPSLKAGNIQIASESNPNQLGQQIAQVVYGGIGK
jgi:hypothetical protein